MTKSALEQLPTDIQWMIFMRLPFAGADALARTCTPFSRLFWEQFPRYTQAQHVPSHVMMLRNMVALNRPLSSSWSANPRMSYPLLSFIYRHANSLLNPCVRNDPMSAWVIAAICGLDTLVEEFLPQGIAEHRDSYGRGVLAYFALGGHLKIIEKFVAAHHPHFDQKTCDPKLTIARCAALGGQVHVLKYLQKTLGYDLGAVIDTSTEYSQHETLFTVAIDGGHKPCVDFLRQYDTKNDDLTSAMIAAHNGHWDLFEQFIKTVPSEQVDKKLRKIVQLICKSGNLNQFLQYYPKISASTKLEIFFPLIVQSENTNLFWYCVDQKLLSIDQTLTRFNTPIPCLIARSGNLPLLKKVLNLSPQGLYAVDQNGQSLLHYAAAGNQWHVYEYLMDKPKDKPLPSVDHSGLSVAHSAACTAAVAFLMRLRATQPDAMQSLSEPQKQTLFHSAARVINPNFAFMLSAFGVDPKAQDSDGNTAIHLIAQKATDKPYLWRTIADMIQQFGVEIINIQNGREQTVFDLVQEQDAFQYLPPSVRQITQ